MLTLDGKTLRYDKAFTHNGVQYPKNWLRLTTLEEKQAIGIVEVPDQPTATWDQRFYWGVDNPKNLDELKILWKEKQNETAASLLAPSDWRVVKSAEVTAYSVETVWLNYRAAVRSACNTRQAEIDACVDVPALKELLFGSATITQLDDDGNETVIDNPNIATPWPTEP